MALILRGKNKGKHVAISQWCNDWVTIKNKPRVYSITALKFTKKEFSEILHDNNLGMMLGWFKPDLKTRTFKRRKLNEKNRY
jgi:hypothetical protein